MAIGDDFSISITGDIRHVSGATHYTVLQLHRWLQSLVAQQSASGNDLADITSLTPSERSTDQIITLLNGFNIDDTAAEYLYGGSITQDDGDTCYYGLRVLGAVNNTNTQLQVVQDNVLYEAGAPFWGDQSTGGYNGNAAQQVLMRVLIKVREFGADIDGKRIRVQARHWGDTYDFFNVTMGAGESVAAISTTPDAQNDTLQATVTAYTHVQNSGTVPVDAQDETFYDNSPTTEGTFSGGTGHAASDVITLTDGTKVTVDNVTGGVVDQFTVDNSQSGGAASGETLSQVSTTGSGTGFSLTLDDDNVEVDPDVPVGGYQLIDLGNGDGDNPYYSAWTFTTDTSGDQIKGIWEYIKDLTGDGSAKYLDGVAGEVFLGITHSFVYDNESGGPFREHEIVCWGTDVTYDTLAGGTFAVGDYVVFTRAGVYVNAGKVLDDNGSTQMKVALETTTALADGDVITVADGVGAVTAAIDTTITNNDKAGGEGVLLALYDAGATGTMWIQLIHGSAPVDNLPILGQTTGATCDVDTTVTPRTVPKIFLGSYTGSLIGAYGIGLDSNDLTASDRLQDLNGDTQIPPNNVTFSVTTLESGEDRVLVGPKDPGASTFDWDQMTLNGTLNGPGVTTVVVNAIPANTPQVGVLRITLDDGRRKYVSYTAHDGSTDFTIPSTDFTDPEDATTGNAVMCAYIDKLAASDTESYTTIYTAGPQSLWVRVRDGGDVGGTPIKTFESIATLGSAGGSIAALRISDA